jgi:hypothetical protein
MPSRHPATDTATPSHHGPDTAPNRQKSHHGHQAAAKPDAAMPQDAATDATPRKFTKIRSILDRNGVYAIAPLPGGVFFHFFVDNPPYRWDDCLGKYLTSILP